MFPLTFDACIKISNTEKKVTTFVNHCVGELFNKIKSISDVVRD